MYTWCDASDPIFSQKYSECRQKLGKGKEHYPKNKSHYYRDNDELRYALRSAESCAPWFRRIYLVTNGQVPVWLNTKDPRIRVITHEQIIPKDFLPTFNSKVIEAYIHYIPELAEHFVYCNDDFFFSKPVKPEDFFTTNGLPYLYTDWRHSRREGYANPKSTHAYSYGAVRDYMARHGCPYTPNLITMHGPHPQTVSNATGAFLFFEPAVKEFSKNRFRTNGDMAFYCHAIPLWSYAHKRTVPCDTPYIYMNTKRFDRKAHYSALLKDKNTDAAPMFFCLNDVGDPPKGKKHTWLKDLHSFLDAFFPEPSRFEKACIA